ncbi:MAG TPA: hypothetical protein VF715_07565 [Thermoleophilaceae bacterium]
MLRATPIRELTVETGDGPDAVAAASGLVRAGAHVYVIADDRLELAAFGAECGAPGRLRRMLPGELPEDPAERKLAKPDLEALALLPGAAGAAGPGGALLALGSGSRDNRRRGVVWRLAATGALEGDPQPVDLAPLYTELERAIPDLNVEGAAVRGGELLLFQRGNGAAGVNAAIALDLAAARADLAAGTMRPEAITGIRHYDLGTTGGVRLAFSDAAPLPDGRIVYSAVAEAGDDTFHDGECVGAGIGVIEAGGALGRFEALEPASKVEGVEARAHGRAIDLLMVADPDDPDAVAELLGARVYPQ